MKRVSPKSWTFPLKTCPLFPRQLWVQAVLAVGASRRVRHSLETLVVHSASEQAADPGQPSLPHPRVVCCPLARMTNWTHWPPTSSLCFGDLDSLFWSDSGYCFLLFLLLLCPGVLTVVFSIQAGSDQKQFQEWWDDIDGHFFRIIARRLDALGPSQVITDL